jgi:hypothetical protein
MILATSNLPLPFKLSKSQSNLHSGNGTLNARFLSIVAVHGLNPTGTEDHAFATWTSGGKMWLRDFLPTKLTTARVMVFDYNANVAFTASINGIREHATVLLSRLNDARKVSRLSVIKKHTTSKHFWDVGCFGQANHICVPQSWWAGCQ